MKNTLLIDVTDEMVNVYIDTFISLVCDRELEIRERTRRCLQAALNEANRHNVKYLQELTNTNKEMRDFV